LRVNTRSTRIEEEKEEEESSDEVQPPRRRKGKKVFGKIQPKMPKMEVI